jgi:predicted Ser/Thr protein kinase
MPEALTGRPSVATLTRSNLTSVITGYVKKGAWNKADVLLAEMEEGEVAVKDYAAKIALIRWLGAWQLTREEKAYTRLDGVPGVPRFFGRIDRNAIAMQYVGGTRLPKVHHRMGGVPNVSERVKELLESIHDRGIIHGDLRSRDNFLVTDAGELYLIDYSSAAVFNRGSWGSRVIFPRLKRAEERALLKWKVALAPEELTPEELATHRRFKRLRRLWPFNRKKDLPRTKGRNPLL